MGNAKNLAELTRTETVIFAKQLGLPDKLSFSLLDDILNKIEEKADTLIKSVEEQSDIPIKRED
jgi:hypothetical protein